MSSPSPAANACARVLLIEDSRAMLDSLTAICQGMAHLEVVGSAETAREAVERFTALQPDAVVLDLGLREGSGFDVLHAIKALRPGCRVLVFTSYDAEPYRLRCLAAGADHFFSKTREHRQLRQELAQLVAR